jgi:hypothetical protein
LPESSSAQQSIAQSLTSQTLNPNPSPTNSSGILDKPWTMFILGLIPTAIVTFFVTIMTVKADFAASSVSIAEIKKDIETLKESDKKIELIEKNINEIHTEIAVMKERNSKTKP